MKIEGLLFTSDTDRSQMAIQMAIIQFLQLIVGFRSVICSQNVLETFGKHGI